MRRAYLCAPLNIVLIGMPGSVSPQWGLAGRPSGHGLVDTDAMGTRGHIPGIFAEQAKLHPATGERRAEAAGYMRTVISTGGGIVHTRMLCRRSRAASSWWTGAGNAAQGDGNGGPSAACRWQSASSGCTKSATTFQAMQISHGEYGGRIRLCGNIIRKLEEYSR